MQMVRPSKPSIPYIKVASIHRRNLGQLWKACQAQAGPNKNKVQAPPAIRGMQGSQCIKAIGGYLGLVLETQYFATPETGTRPRCSSPRYSRPSTKDEPLPRSEALLQTSARDENSHLIRPGAWDRLQSSQQRGTPHAGACARARN